MSVDRPLSRPLVVVKNAAQPLLYPLARPLVRSALYSTSALTRFAVNGVEAALALDFIGSEYRTANTATTFADAFMGNSPKLTYNPGSASSSQSTMVNSSGHLVWAPHNLATYSEDLSQWLTTNMTATASLETAPDGSTNAYTLTDDATSGIHTVHIANLAVSLPDKRTNAIWVKAGTARYVTFSSREPSNINVQWNNIFDTTTGVWVLQGTLLANFSKIDAGNGWWKISFTDDTNSLAYDNLYVGIADSDTLASISYSGSGGSIHVWGAHLYRSDLGGMAPVPGAATGFEYYVPTNGNAEYLPRVGHHVYNGSTWVNEGLLIESEARTNLITHSEDFTDAAWTTVRASASLDAVGPDGVTNSAATLSSTNTGGSSNSDTVISPTVANATTYTLSCFAKAGTMSHLMLFANMSANTGQYFDLENGTVGSVSFGTPDNATIEDFGGGWYRCSMTLTTTAASGEARIYIANGESYNTVPQDTTANILIYGAQFEQGQVVNGTPVDAPTPSSYIPTNGSTVTRGGQSLTVPPAEFGWDSSAVSIQMDGRMTYADTGSVEMVFWRWYINNSNRMSSDLRASGVLTGQPYFFQTASGIFDDADASIDAYTPGILTPFNIASRHGSTFINAAVDGVALTADTTPTALPDLSNTDLQIAYDFMGTIGTFRQFAGDIGDTGLVTATNPSTEPTLSLTFDGSEGSFYNLNWSE